MSDRFLENVFLEKNIDSNKRDDVISCLQEFEKYVPTNQFRTFNHACEKWKEITANEGVFDETLIRAYMEISKTFPQFFAGGYTNKQLMAHFPKGTEGDGIYLVVFDSYLKKFSRLLYIFLNWFAH